MFDQGEQYESYIGRWSRRCIAPDFIKKTLPVAIGDVDAVLSGLVLDFIPHPVQVVAEMARVLVPGGIAAAYVWDYAEGMQIMRRFWDVATVLDAGAAAYDEGKRKSVCSPEKLRRVAGTVLLDVEVTDFTAPTIFQGFDAYWQPFLGGQGAAGSYVAGLDDASRESLREALEASLPRTEDGSIHLSARAWAVKGRKTERREANQ
jgi:SAM-dependent methyltransferase